MTRYLNHNALLERRKDLEKQIDESNDIMQIQHLNEEIKKINSELEKIGIQQEEQ